MFYPRKLLKTLEKQISTREIIVLTGMRRVGKTTLYSHLFKKVPCNNKVFIDLENPLEQRVFEEKNYNRILVNLTEYGLNPQSKMYIFLDEIQAKPEVVRAVKYLYDHYKIKFFLSSSNSFYIKNLFPENLAGRKFIFELFPLQFEEFLVFKNKMGKFGASLSQIDRNKNKFFHKRVKNIYDEYLKYGGLPEVVLAEKTEDKILKLNDILKFFFEKEVKSLADFTKINSFRNLIILLAKRTGEKLDISKISSEIGVSRMTIYSYLEFLKDTYLVKFISPFSQNINREITGTKKAYFYDHGIANHFSKVNEDCLFKNCVFSSLLKFGKINYYQKRSGEKIDFILNERIGVEAKVKTLDNNLQKLNKICSKIGINEFYLISKQYVEKANFIPATYL